MCCRFYSGFPVALPGDVQAGVGSALAQFGGKVFAICGWSDGESAVSFKVSDLAFEVLSDMPGIRPAPYLASRGMKWVQVYEDPGLPDVELKAHIEASYEMIKAKLTKKLRTNLGLD